MVNSYDELMGEETDPQDHPAHNVPPATQQYAGDVLPLHAPGTFSKNTQIGDAVNGLAKDLGVKPPKNILKFPGK